MTAGIPRSRNFPGSSFGMLALFTGGPASSLLNRLVSWPGWLAYPVEQLPDFHTVNSGSPSVGYYSLSASFRLVGSSIASKVMLAYKLRLCVSSSAPLGTRADPFVQVWPHSVPLARMKVFHCFYP